MKLAFFDESGYTPNWEESIDEQPYYVLSAICIDSEKYMESCKGIRSAMADLEIPATEEGLGLGCEIKARDIARGSGWWSGHNTERNAIRNLMLSYPGNYNGTAFIAVIDKAAHKEKYYHAQDPATLSFNFICERHQMYLDDNDDFAHLIYDLNHRLKDDLLDYASFLVKNGSMVDYAWYRVMDVDRICELSYGDSRYSAGLQVADFFATLTYQHKKDGEPKGCKWWDLLCSSLHNKDGKINGFGYKTFP